MIEAAIPAERAEDLGLRVGDRLTVSSSPTDLTPTQVVIAGVFSPFDADGEYWMGSASTLLAPEPEGLTDPPPLPLFLTGNTVFRALADARMPMAEGRWFIYLDDAAVRDASPGALATSVEGFDTDVAAALPGSLVLTGLGQPLRSLERELLFARMPVLLMGALLVTIAGYYLFLLSVTLAERGQSAASMLRTRGVTARQLARLYAIETLTVVALPAAVAPLLAVLGIRLLGLLPAYDPLVAGGPLKVELGWVAFAWSAAGAAASFVLLTGPGIMRSRRSIAAERLTEARPERAPFFQRYLLDVAFLAFGGLLIWDLTVRRAAVSSGLFTEQSTNPLLVAAPAFFLAAVALISLRILQPAIRLLGWLAARPVPAWTALGMWRFARRPYWYARPVVLLFLATGTIVFAASLSSTLERSAADTAAYEVGSDLRMILPHVPRGVEDENVRAIKDIPGVTGASLVLRTMGVLGTTGAGSTFRLLAVEPDDFLHVSWFRDDFAELPLSSLLQPITGGAGQTRVGVPDWASHVGVWVRADQPRANQTLRIHIRDSGGRTLSLNMGALDSPDWQYRTTAIPAQVKPPAELTAVTVFETVKGDAGTPGTVYLDNIDVTRADEPGDPRREVLVSFEERGDWLALPTSQGYDTLLEFRRAEGGGSALGPGTVPGSSVAVLGLGRGTDGGFRGFYQAAADAFPAIASVAFLEESDFHVGDVFAAEIFDRLVPIAVAGETRFFPTVDPGEGGFLVVNAEELWDYLTLRGWTIAAASAELIVSVDETEYDTVRNEIEDTLEGLPLVFDRRELAEDSLVTPLAVAGWYGVGLVTASLAVVIAVMGYATHVAGGAARAILESAILRAVGLTRLGFLLITATEHAVVVALGAGAGVAAGIVMTRMAVAAASQTEPGREPLPPVLLVTDWVPVGLLYGALAVAALLAVAAMTLAFARFPLGTLGRRAE